MTVNFSDLKKTISAWSYWTDSCVMLCVVYLYDSGFRLCWMALVFIDSSNGNCCLCQMWYVLYIFFIHSLVFLFLLDFKLKIDFENSRFSQANFSALRENGFPDVTEVSQISNVVFCVLNFCDPDLLLCQIALIFFALLMGIRAVKRQCDTCLIFIFLKTELWTLNWTKLKSMLRIHTLVPLYSAPSPPHWI